MTREHRFDSDPIPDVDSPAFRSAVADRCDRAERFVTGYCRHRRAKDAFILLVVAATDSAGIDPHEPGVVGDLWHRNVHRFELTRCGLNHRKTGLREGHR